MKNEEKVDLSALKEELPPFVMRNFPRLKELTGYAGRTMANMDSKGETASIKRIRIGAQVAYERESLIKWLEERSYVLDQKEGINNEN